MENLLEIRNLCVQYGTAVIVDDASLSLGEGEWLMLVGPNGAGKSTIVNAITQGAPYTGEILYRGKDIRKYRADEMARNIGMLDQNHFLSYSFTVGEVVRLGRYAYTSGIFRTRDDEGTDRVERALEMTGMTHLADHSVLKLSGGELQRMFLAQLFAQDPRLLILDEPTNHLDLIYQKQVFELIASWLREEGRAVISVVHDLSLAKAYGTKAVLLNKGKVLARGSMEEVFSKEHLEEAYAMDVYAWMKKMLGQWEEETGPLAEKNR